MKITSPDQGHAEGWDLQSIVVRRDGGAQLLAGAATLGWGLLVGLLVPTVAYGGVWRADLLERVLWFSPAIVAVVAGLVLLTIGT